MTFYSQLLLGENIAESGGLSITFNAYQSLIHEQGPEQLLPDLEHLTPKQLLFASHGVFTCEVTPKIIAQKLAVSIVSSKLLHT